MTEVESRTERVEMADGVELSVRTYFPPGTSETGRTLWIVHGALEHGGRYQHVARAGVARGWRVLIPDLRGHGLSEGTRVHIQHHAQYLSDLRELAGHYHVIPRRTALLGHSFGGLLAIRYLELHPQGAAALVASAPALNVAVPVDALTLALGRLVSMIAPRTRFRSRIERGWLSRDPEILRQRDEDPLLNRSVTARWFFEMNRLAAVTRADARLVQVPVLVLHGRNEHITSPAASRAWFEQIASTDKEYWENPDWSHEILNDLDRAVTIERVYNWLDQRVPASLE